MSTETKASVAVAEIVKETRDSLAISDQIKAALVTDLGPVYDRLAQYELDAAEIIVNSEATATKAVAVYDAIAADIKTVEDHEILAKITKGLHGLHKKWTAFRGGLTTPLETARKTIKNKVITWQEAERVKAEEEQRRLQAEADAKARAEQEKLLKKAEAAKRPETIERYQEQAAAVQASTVRVEAPKSTLRVTRVWAVKSIDQAAFFAALATRQDLRGLVTIDQTKLARVKAANPMFEAPGVEFHQPVR